MDGLIIEIEIDHLLKIDFFFQIASLFKIDRFSYLWNYHELSVIYSEDAGDPSRPRIDVKGLKGNSNGIMWAYQRTMVNYGSLWLTMVHYC